MMVSLLSFRKLTGMRQELFFNVYDILDLGSSIDRLLREEVGLNTKFKSYRK